MGFAITRPDGRSYTEVLIDKIKDDQPGKIYKYDELQELLGFDDTHRVQSQVTRSQRIIAKQLRRVLINVRGVGYRLGFARDHRAVGLSRKEKADRQLLLGATILRNVHWDELTETERTVHEGTLMMIEGIIGKQAAYEERQSRIEAAIEKISSRLSAVEGK